MTRLRSLVRTHLDLARRGGGLLARPEDVEVRVRADTVSVATGREGMYATVNVRVTGIGLSAEDRERVFEEFYRVRRARGT